MFAELAATPSTTTGSISAPVVAAIADVAAVTAATFGFDVRMVDVTVPEASC